MGKSITAIAGKQKASPGTSSSSSNNNNKTTTVKKEQQEEAKVVIILDGEELEQDPKSKSYKKEEHPDNPATNTYRSGYGLKAVPIHMIIPAVHSWDKYQPRIMGRGCIGPMIPEDTKFVSTRASVKNDYFDTRPLQQQYSHLPIAKSRNDFEPKLYLNKSRYYTSHIFNHTVTYHGACYVAATGKYPEDGQQGAHPCSCTFCRYCEMVPPSVNEEQKECSWVFLVQPTRLFLQCPHNPPCFPSANKLVYIMSVPLTGPAPTRAVSSDIIDAAKVECYRAIQSMTHPDYYAQRIQIRHSNLNRLL